MLLHHYKLLTADRSNLLVMTCLIARASASFRILVIARAVPLFGCHCEGCLLLLQNYKLLTADRSNLLMTTRLIARAATSLRILVITTAVPPFAPRHCEGCPAL